MRGFSRKSWRRLSTGDHSFYQKHTAFQRGATRNGRGSLKMGLITIPESILYGKPRFEHHGLILHVTIADPYTFSALDASVDVADSALSKANLVEALALQGDLIGMHELVILAFSTRPEYNMDMHRMPRNLANRRAQRYCVTFGAVEEAGLISRETGAPRRELFKTLLDNLSCGTRMRLEKHSTCHGRLDSEMPLPKDADTYTKSHED